MRVVASYKTSYQITESEWYSYTNARTFDVNEPIANIIKWRVNAEDISGIKESGSVEIMLDKASLECNL